MKKLFFLSPFVFILFSILFSCDQEAKKDQAVEKQVKEKTPLNPNGDSELAVLMRGMYDEMDRIGRQIEEEEDVHLELDHLKILTAHATEPEKANSQQFKAFAQLYLSRLEDLKAAESEERKVVYKSLVESCMSCHQAICPGPMVKIKKLRKLG